MRNQFYPDSRAVSSLVGVILLFGFLIIGLSLYQATVIPSDNSKAEFIHSQEVQNDLVDLRDATHNSGADTLSRSSPVTLGTYYNARIFTINPAQPVGTVSTKDSATNITVEPNSSSESTEWKFSTNYIQYEPQYREYQDPPTTIIEHTLIYNSFELANTSQTRSGQRIIEPNRLVIPIVEGNVSITGTDTVSLRVTHRERKSVDNSDNVSVTFPTRVPELWEKELASENIDNVTITTTPTTVEIEADVSEVIMYRVELGEHETDSSENRITDEITTS